jgi:hypothetical protein
MDKENVVYKYIYTIEYFSPIKKNKIMSFAGKWMDLEVIKLSEISQTQKDKYCENLTAPKQNKTRSESKRGAIRE